MPKNTVEFPQPLHPTPGQRRGLLLMGALVRTAHLATHTWLLHQAAGYDVTLLQAAGAVTGQGDTLPALPRGDALVRLTIPGQKQVLRLFRDVRDALGWSRQVPASALDWAAAETLRAWQAPGPGGRRFDVLPRPWSPDRLAELHLDNAVQPVDDVTLEIGSLDAVALVETDLFLLPTPYHQALWHRQRTRLANEATRLNALEQAVYDHGRADMAGTLLRLRARYAASGLDLDGQVVPPESGPHSPRCRDSVVVREIELDGRRQWQVVWNFAVPDPLPWVIDDVLGIDPGQRHSWAYASGAMSGVIPRAVATGWTLPAPPADAGLALLGERRARALARRAVFRRMWPGHQQLLSLALSHRVCAVEAVQWAGFKWRKNNFAAFAGDSGPGIRAVLGWLNALAPLHGVEVIETPARFSTRTCSSCDRIGARPGGGRPFSCRCGHRELADINAARIHRQRAQAILAGRPRGR